MSATKNFNLSPEWVLVFVSALWGSSFIMLSISLKDISPSLLVALRFSLGTIIMAFILRSKLLQLRKTDILAGFLTGTCIFLGYFLQTVGLQWIPSSISAFLTALYVPFVPLLQWVILRRAPGFITTAGILVAFFGMMLIINPFAFSLVGNLGECLTVASAFACAMEIIVIGKYANDCDPKVFCFTQLAFVSLYAILYCCFFEEVRFTPTPASLLSLAGLVGIIVFNQCGISWAQKQVSPVRAVLIYSLEPVFAGLIGILVGEKFTTMAAIGALLVLSSVLITSFLPKYLQERAKN